MTLSPFKVCCALSILLTCGLGNAVGQQLDTNFVDGAIYFKLQDNEPLLPEPYDNSVVALNLLFTNYSLDTVYRPFAGLSSALDRTYRLQFLDSSGIDSLVAGLELLPMIDYAEKVPLHKLQGVPNDIAYEQWQFANMNAEFAWNITLGSPDVVVAIVDNAVSTTHQDLAPVLWTNSGEIAGNGLDDDLNGYTDDTHGFDVADGDDNPNPPASAGTDSPFTHGTHCAGIAAAKTNNGVGVASIGYGISYMPVKCSTDNSSEEGAALTHAYEGVSYATRAGADIISMSWVGTSLLSLTGQNVIDAASAAGIVLIGAAGNANSTDAHYPAAFANVISVGSTAQLDQKSGFSNYGQHIDLMAPGSFIYSTLSGADDAYGTQSGTSMACPMTAGVAGLLLSLDPSLSPQQVRDALLQGCNNIDAENPNYQGQLGAGRLNAEHALNIALNVIEAQDADVQALNVFPNPATKVVAFQTQQPGTAYIFGATGQLLQTTSVQSNTTNLDVSRIPSGVVLLVVETKHERKSTLILIEH